MTLVSRRVGVGVLGARGTKEVVQSPSEILGFTFDVKAYDVLEMYGSSPKR